MPKILKQGDTYDQNDVDAVNDSINGPEHDNESSEATMKSEKFNGMNPTLVIGLIIAGVLLLLVLIMVIVKNNTGDASSDVSDDSLDVSAEALLQQAQQGTVIDTYGTEVYEETPTTAVEPVEYSDTEAVTLRKYGYTADEIEFSREQGISYETMLEDAQLAQQEIAQQYVAGASDTGSAEYQRLINMTWLSGAPFHIEPAQPDEYGNMPIEYSAQTINADFVKCGEQGTQLYLKLDLGALGSAFMTVDPQRWVQLGDSGNIVVSVQMCSYNGVNVITDVFEIDTGDHEEY